ncbi:hypothetical protein EJ08DRAFT_681143 [Tothia fuscella]|uniref:Transmembrane protein n=1 Tax=Tothia fuscella TaxID=1048955 RepID=A0A9P4NM35_9PEZI|nr:hypothetical protein EJ08DRAFT_681143 [Tothia fuscella]
MNTLHLLVRRDGTTTTITPTMMNLLIALVVLFASIAVLTGGLLILRSVRRSRKDDQESLPQYSEVPTATRSANHRRRSLTISTPAYVIQEKQSLINSSASPPPSPVPEIRITFPEEVDRSGKRTSGRVVVVHVGEHSVGLEPVNENLPPYQQSEGERFQSLDLDRMGGLKEKETMSDGKRWS